MSRKTKRRKSNFFDEIEMIWLVEISHERNEEAPLSDEMNEVVLSGTYRYHVERSYVNKIKRVATRDFRPFMGERSLFFMKEEQEC